MQESPSVSKLVVISGGTAANCLVNVYGSLSASTSYILPISDNGGSTSEILRVIGGPAIGDIRNRIVQLIPLESRRLKMLFSYRLPEDHIAAKQEWTEIIEGTHQVWTGIESHYKEMIRPFLVHVHVEILKRSRLGKEFCFIRASVGNLFLTGARLFCGSLDSAIEILSKFCSLSCSVSVLPALNTNFTHHISALLENGTVVRGQSQISHPAGLSDDIICSSSKLSPEEDCNLPFVHPDLTSSQINFSKAVESPLPSPISRIFYINPYGQEIHPRASTRVLSTLSQADVIIYSIGSLFTSLMPIMILDEVATQIANCPIKILILNGENDRETAGLTALDYVQTIVDACIYSSQQKYRYIDPWSKFITHLIYIEDSLIPVDLYVFNSQGVKCLSVKPESPSCKRYDLGELEKVLQRCVLDKPSGRGFVTRPDTIDIDFDIA